MAYYARPTCGLSDDMFFWLGATLVLKQYLKVEDFYSGLGGFYSGGDFFPTKKLCSFLDYEGHWDLLRKEMFTENERGFLEMMIPDLQWYNGEYDE